MRKRSTSKRKAPKGNMQSGRSTNKGWFRQTVKRPSLAMQAKFGHHKPKLPIGQRIQYSDIQSGSPTSSLKPGEAGRTIISKRTGGITRYASLNTSSYDTEQVEVLGIRDQHGFRVTHQKVETGPGYFDAHFEPLKQHFYLGPESGSYQLEDFLPIKVRAPRAAKGKKPA